MRVKQPTAARRAMPEPNEHRIADIAGVLLVALGVLVLLSLVLSNTGILGRALGDLLGTLFGHGAWAANIMTIPGDMVPHRLVGTLYGVTALGGGLGSILFMQLTGKLVDMQQSFNTVFIIAGILPMLAAVIILTLTGKIELMRLPGITEETVPAGIPAAS